MGSSWSGAFGVSYELRGTYDPGTSIGALSSTEYSPGDALRISTGLDGLLGKHDMTLGLSADLYPTNDVIADQGGLDAPGPGVHCRLAAATWEPPLSRADPLRVDRFRTRYSSGISHRLTPVQETSGNYLDAGIRSVLSAGPATGVLAGVNFRHQTGLKVSDTFATAGMVSGALTLGVLRELGGGYVVQPFM